MFEPTRIPTPGRRVVTGVNTSGKSIVISDGPVPKDATWFEPGIGRGCDLWIASRVPIDLTDQSDSLVGYTIQDWPSPGGVIAKMITWEPGFKFPMHRSDTIDFLFIISGQLELITPGGLWETSHAHLQPF